MQALVTQPDQAIAADYALLCSRSGLRRELVSSAVSELIAAGWVAQRKQQRKPALYQLFAPGQAAPQGAPACAGPAQSEPSAVSGVPNTTQAGATLPNSSKFAQSSRSSQSSLEVLEVREKQYVQVQSTALSALQCNANFENFQNFEDFKQRMVALFKEYGIDEPMRTDLAQRVCDRHKDHLEAALQDVTRALEHMQQRAKNGLVKRAVGASIKVLRDYAASGQMTLFPVNPPKAAPIQQRHRPARIGNTWRREQVEYTDERRDEARERARERISARAAKAQQQMQPWLAAAQRGGECHKEPNQ
jgi:hypothetical protein